MFWYKAFGLIIESEIELDKLILTDDKQKSDVEIIVGKVPEIIDNIQLKRLNLLASPNEMIFTVKNVARYFIQNGNKITIEPLTTTKKNQIYIYLLGTCIGVLMQQRGTLLLHGSCVYKDRKSVLFTGVSGAGKSTMAALFLSKGWKLITDDVTSVYVKNEHCYASPSYPYQKLWEDSFRIANTENRKDSIAWYTDNRKKYMLDTKNQFYDEDIVLNLCCHIKLCDTELTFTELHDLVKVDTLMRNTYRRRLISDFKGKQNQFSKCVEIAKYIKVLGIERPKNTYSEKEIASYIIGFIENGGSSND